MVDDNPAEEDDDFELDLEAVDVVSFGSPFVSMGFVELELESIRWQCPGGGAASFCLSVVGSCRWRCLLLWMRGFYIGGTRYTRSLFKT